MPAKLISLLSILIVIASLSPALADPADLVITGAAVYTVDPAHPWAEAIAVKDGRIVFVGDEAGAAAFVGPKTRVEALKGGMVLPGLIDSHVHLVEGGVELGRCALTHCETAEDVRKKIRAYVRAHPEKKWIVGSGWDVALYPRGNPTRQELDALVPDRPAALYSSDGHSLWVNSRALQLAKITARTPDPKRGRIERDVRGNPSGTLREGASDLIDNLLPPLTPQEGMAGFLRAQKMAHRFGITSIQDAHASREFLDVYRRADAEGKLQLRVTAALHTDASKGPEQVDAMIAERAKKSSPLLHVRSAKFFLDGVIETHTAAMLAAYSDGIGGTGILNWTPERLKQVVARLDAEGFQVHIHAIGDRAVREALNAYEAARRANGTHDARHHIAHLQMIDAADIPRFKALDVTANFQSFWMQADADAVKLDMPALGPRRFARQYPIADVAKTGATIVGGSDWSVTTLNPLDAIEVAVTHRALGDAKSKPYVPDQRIGLALAIRAYTRDAAWLNFEDADCGSIEVGKYADLCVLDRNLFEMPPSEIHSARVLHTYLQGRPVYHR